MRDCSPLFLILLRVAVVAAATSGCSARQAYDSGQAWQRNQCNRIVDSVERERCIDATRKSYEDYKRERESIKQ